MGLPLVDLQAAFGYGPRDASPSWTNLPGLSSVKTSRGRSHLASRFEAGTLDASFDTAATGDDRYDPAFTTGPYGTDLLPLVPVRLLIGDTPMTLGIAWQGFAESWGTDRASQGRGAAKLHAVDIFKLLAYKRLRDTAYFDAVQALTPDWFWRLDDKLVPSSAYVNGAVSPVSGPAGRQIGTPESVDGPLVTDPDPALHIDYTKGYVQVPFVDDLGLNTAYSVVFWMRTSSTGVNVSTPVYPSSNPNGSAFGTAPIIQTLQIESGTGYLITGWSLFLGALPGGATAAAPSVLYHVVHNGVGGSTSGLNTAADVVVNDGKWHHIAVTRDGGSTMRIYVDGVQKASQAGATASVAGSRQGSYLGHAISTDVGTPAPSSFAGDLKDMAWWFNTTLSAAQILNLYNAGIFPAETVGDRLNRCLDVVGVPAGWRSLDTGPDLIAYTDPLHHAAALEHMQLCVDSDGGQMFTGRTGTIFYHRRTHATPAPSGTFSDKASGSEVPYQPSGGPQLDDADVYNEVSIDGPGIAPVLLTDSTSDGQYGSRTWSLGNCQLANQSDADALGTAKIGLLAQPSVRLASITYTVPDATFEAFNQASHRELLDVIQVKQYGPGNPTSPFSQALYIEHMDMEIVPMELFKATYAVTAII